MAANSVFTLNTLFDPTGHFPERVTLKVTQRGIDFFSPDPEVILKQFQWPNVMCVSKSKSGNSKLVLTLNVDGDIIQFQFQTKEAEEIWSTFQPYIHDFYNKLQEELDALKQKLEAVTSDRERLLQELQDKTNELAASEKFKELYNKLQEELDALKQTLNEKDRELQDKTNELAAMTNLYKEEQVERKRYFNLIEEMKGKIRVWAGTLGRGLVS